MVDKEQKKNSHRVKFQKIRTHIFQKIEIFAIFSEDQKGPRGTRWLLFQGFSSKLT